MILRYKAILGQRQPGNHFENMSTDMDASTCEVYVPSVEGLCISCIKFMYLVYHGNELK